MSYQFVVILLASAVLSLLLVSNMDAEGSEKVGFWIFLTVILSVGLALVVANVFS